MKNPIFLCFLLSSLLITEARAQKAVAHATINKSNPEITDALFRSASLARVMHYRVLLPADYNQGARFPVLYLLHGLYGDYKNWDTMTGLEDYAKNLHMIVVMPDADDSWYTNSATISADKFEDYISKDLISEIDEKFRTIRDRHGQAIAGLSMGGYASVKFGLKYPQLFAFAGSLSGAFNAAQDLDKLRPEFRAKLLGVFGDEGSPVRAENDVFTLLTSSHSSSYPYFYIACGTADSFLDTNRAFVHQLSSRDLAYEYHETAGGHTWEYWDRELQPLLWEVDSVLGANATRVRSPRKQLRTR
jgi:putative tributyrin esterase